MYLINVVIQHNPNESAAQAEEKLNIHRAWFAKYFEQGNFLLLGPYLDQAHAGVIIAQATSRAELDAILAEDVYWQGGASYEVREFKAAMASDKLAEFQGK